MKRLLIERRRWKRVMKVTEGRPDESTVRRFVGLVDDQALETLQVEPEQRKQFEQASLREKAKFITPYLDRYLQRMVMLKQGLNREQAEEIALEIGRNCKLKSGAVQLPYKPLKELTGLNAAVMLKLQRGSHAFYYPTAMLHRVLSSMSNPQVVWDPQRNLLIVGTREGSSRSRFTLISQPRDRAESLNPIKIALNDQAQSYSVTDLLLKAAESLLSA